MYLDMIMIDNNIVIMNSLSKVDVKVIQSSVETYLISYLSAFEYNIYSTNL